MSSMVNGSFIWVDGRVSCPWILGRCGILAVLLVISNEMGWSP